MAITIFKERNDGCTLSSEDIEQLRCTMKGAIVTKSGSCESDYQDAVTRWNHVSIKPANIVVFVEDEEDIVSCVRFVKKHHLDVAVTGGRHSYHGASSSTGMVIDLRRMRNVSVDKAAMTATAQGGCIARDVEEPCGAVGLAPVFGAVNETGIGGLTLGGGVGFLTGAHGLAADNLMSARMVLANSEIVNVSDEENRDLFWAIRGGGPNFGIVTQFKFRVHKQGPVFSEMIFFSPEKVEACLSVVNKMHDISLKAGQGNFQVMLAYLRPPGALELCPTFRIIGLRSEDEAKELAAPIYALGPTKIVGGMIEYAKITEPPPYMHYPGFERYAASSAHMDYPLDESLLLNVLDRFQKVTQKYPEHLKASKCILDLRNYEKVASIPADAMAYSGRFDCSWIIPDLQWDDPALDTTMRKEVTNITAYIREEMQKKQIKTPGHRDVTAIYPNISAGGEEKAKSVFGPNLSRLQVLKKQYDPDFMWNKWFPIVPT